MFDPFPPRYTDSTRELAQTHLDADHQK